MTRTYLSATRFIKVMTVRTEPGLAPLPASFCRAVREARKPVVRRIVEGCFVFGRVPGSGSSQESTRACSGGIEVKADHVHKLRSKFRIVRDFERLYAMRLQPVVRPASLKPVFADSESTGHTWNEPLYRVQCFS